MAKPNLTTEPTTPVPVIKGSLPKAAGTILSADRLSPWEKKQLQDQFGWDGVSDVPSDLAERMENADFQQAFVEAAQAVPEGFQPPTKDLDLSQVKTVYDEAAVAAEAERIAKRFERWDTEVKGQVAPEPAPQPNPTFEEVRKQAIDEISEAKRKNSVHPEIQNALNDLQRELNTQEIRAEDQSSAKPEPVAAVKEAPKQEEKSLDEQMEDRLTEQDKEDYREAVITFGRYQKTYDLLGGAIRVTFADIGVDDHEMMVKQESIDKLVGRIRADIGEILTNSNNLSLALALRKVELVSQGQCPVEIPESQSTSEFLAELFKDRTKFELTGVLDEDTNLRYWTRFLAKTVLSGSFSHLIYQAFEEFKGVMQALRHVSKRPEFFSKPAQ